MTHQNELNTNRRSRIIDDIRYTRWIIGGVVTLAIVIAAYPLGVGRLAELSSR